MKTLMFFKWKQTYKYNRQLYNLFLIAFFIIICNTKILAQGEVISGQSEIKKIKIVIPEEAKTYEGAEKPVLRITNPSVDNYKSNLKLITIEGYTYAKDGSGIDKVLINGQPAIIDVNDQFSRPVFLRGDTNLFVIKSCSKSGLVTEDTLLIVYSQSNTKNYLLVMAVEDYKFWPRLKNPVNDANSLIDVLTNKYQFENTNVMKLYNQQCTIDSIDKAFRQLINQVNEEDNVLIFFAGHGYFDKVLQEGYWIPANARLQSTNDYLNNSIMMKYIAALKSKHTLVMADACFSGSLFASETRAEAEKLNYKNYEKRKSRWAFTSGRMEEVLDASPFAKYIVEYLNNNERTEFIFEEMADFVTTSVSYNSDQMPKAGPLVKVGDEGGQFVFKLKGEE